jgi:DNA-binding transcriptional ArsR family regulator
MEIKQVLSALTALSQETRLAIFRLLVEKGEDGLAVGKIGERLQVAPATLSFHIKELASASLVTTRQEGRFIYCSANFQVMNSLMTYLTKNCCGGQSGGCAPACTPVRSADKRRTAS